MNIDSKKIMQLSVALSNLKVASMAVECLYYRLEKNNNLSSELLSITSMLDVAVRSAESFLVEVENASEHLPKLH